MTTATPLQAVILIGASGSGKTWVGEVLSRRLGLEFLDLERMLLDEYGTTEEFLANKPAALQWFEARVRETIRTCKRTVIFEVGAFSQQQTVRRVREDFDTILVLVEAPRETRLQRLRKREKGRNLIESVEDSVKYDHLFDAELKPTFEFALEITNRDLTEPELVRLFRDFLARSERTLFTRDRDAAGGNEPAVG